MTRPLARKDGLYVEQIADEVILYDKGTHKAHCLNKTAAAVWEAADGTRTVEELAGVLEAKLNIPKDRDIVLLALEQLQSTGLLSSEVSAESDRPSRRQIGRKLAMAGVSASLVPVIASVLAPTPAMASSPGTGVSKSIYVKDLGIVNSDIADNPKQYLTSKSAQDDYLKGLVDGVHGDFADGVTDFNDALKVLGLPPLS